MKGKGSIWLLAATAGVVQAQSLEPRFYSNAPVGMNFALAGYTFVYRFWRGLWMALGGTGYAGGRTVVGGEVKSDLQQSSRLGLTLACPVGRDHAIKVYASSGVSTRTGSDFDTAGVAWQYRWGSGLVR